MGQLDIKTEQPPAYQEVEAKPPAYPAGYVDSIQPVQPAHNLDAADTSYQVEPPAETRRDDAPSRRRGPPMSYRALKVNLSIANWTVGIMFVVAIIDMAFAGVALEDLRGDTYDYSCEYNYIADASLPWDGRMTTKSNPGRYHGQCRLLYTWTHIVIVAGAFSMARAFLGAVPVHEPSFWTLSYSQGSWMDKTTTPSRVYLVRAFFSFVPCVLYLVSTIMLAMNRLITAKPADDSYRTMYLICLALLALSTLMSAYQVLFTALASWGHRGRGRNETTEYAFLELRPNPS